MIDTFGFKDTASWRVFDISDPDAPDWPTYTKPFVVKGAGFAPIALVPIKQTGRAGCDGCAMNEPDAPRLPCHKLPSCGGGVIYKRANGPNILQYIAERMES